MRHTRPGSLWIGFLLLVNLCAAAGTPDGAKPGDVGPEIRLKLRVHGLKSEVPEVNAVPDEAALKEMVTHINAIWAPANIHFELESIVQDDALAEDAQREFAALTKRLGREAGPATARNLARMIPKLPVETGLFHIVLVHRFPLGLGGRYFPELGFVVTPQVVPRRPPGPPPTDEEEPVAEHPLEPKVMAHELGHALSLRHVALPENLMTSGPNTRGILRGDKLTREQIVQARRVAVEGTPFLLPEPRGEPKPLLTRAGKLLLHEEFSGPRLPENWNLVERPDRFSIVSGALQVEFSPDEGRGPVIVAPVKAHDLTIAFSVKLVKPGGLILVLDGEGQFTKSAHVLSVALNPSGVAVRQERGDPATKQPHPTKRKGAPGSGRKAPLQPTKEQLADPKFFRVEQLALKPARLDSGDWVHVLVELHGNDVVVQVGGSIVLLGSGSVLDVRKTKMAFVIDPAATLLIDDVKVWENSLLPDAPLIKARLSAESSAKP